MHTFGRALCALGAIAAVTTSEAASAPLAASAFAYAAGTTHVTVTKRMAGGASLVTFPSGARTVTAEVIRPAHGSAGKMPAVLFVHWLGDPKTTNHTEFESDARELAKHGVLSLLIDEPWSQQHWFMQIRSTQTDYADSIADVLDLRRSLDVLTQLGADPSRIAYVGHDFGAMYGAVLSGVDTRPKYFVLMAGTSSFAQWYLLGKKPADVDAYREQIMVFDPPQYLHVSKAGGFLMQFASKDEYIDANEARAFYDAAPMPKLVGFYATDHSLDIPQAHLDRIGWLLVHFGLT